MNRPPRPPILIVHARSMSGADMTVCGIAFERLLPGHSVARHGERVAARDACLTCRCFVERAASRTPVAGE